MKMSLETSNETEKPEAVNTIAKIRSIFWSSEEGYTTCTIKYEMSSLVAALSVKHGEEGSKCYILDVEKSTLELCARVRNSKTCCHWLELLQAFQSLKELTRRA
jgi:hypothetical protein